MSKSTDTVSLSPTAPPSRRIAVFEGNGSQQQDHTNATSMHDGEIFFYAGCLDGIAYYSKERQDR